MSDTVLLMIDMRNDHLADDGVQDALGRPTRSRAGIDHPHFARFIRHRADRLP
ncbi:hypothetical protein [Amycolatopsis sp. H20-H5]|uniref:hypothetical protein n=1 Tax=Amycolatopsis sp. H20-H5 TaxID=3046309 RepID=UPI002DBD5C74|nr:hypothetical protein [Amycolatopsis sp. H20-H5]MEC3975569.1 hypothetical protein [Amycolatopsis sp. H20-H5]